MDIKLLMILCIVKTSKNNILDGIDLGKLGREGRNTYKYICYASGA